MNCPSCGKEITEDVKFCPMCGTPAPKREDTGYCVKCGEALGSDAKFCVNCGNPVVLGNKPETGGDIAGSGPEDGYTSVNGSGQRPDYSVTGEGAESSRLEAYGNEPITAPLKKKKGKGLIIAIALIIVAILFGASAILASTFFKRDFLQLIQGKNKYSRDYILNKTKIMYNGFIEAAAAANKMSGSVLDVSKGSAEMSVVMSADKKQADKIVDSFGLYGYEELILRLLMDSGIFISMDYDAGQDSIKASVDAKWKLEDSDILSVNSVIKDNFLYVGVPEVYGEYFSFDLGETGIIDMENYSYSGYESRILEFVESNKETAKVMLYDLTKSALSETNSLTLNNNVILSINYESVKFDEILLELNEEDAEKAALAVLRTLLDKNDYIVFLSELLNYAEDADYYDEEYIRDEISDMINEIEEYGVYLDDNITVSLYVDSGNNLAGIQIKSGESVIGYAYDFKTGYEFWTSDEDNDWRCYGKLKGGPMNFSGDMWLEVLKSDGVEYELTLKLLDFQLTMKPGSEWDLSFSASIPSGYIFEQINNDVEDIMYEVPYIITEYMYNSEINLTIAANNKAVSAGFELTDKKDGISLTVDTKRLVGISSEISAPDSSKIADFDLDSLPDGKAREMLGNILNVLEKISGMGYDVNALSDSFRDMMSYLDNSDFN